MATLLPSLFPNKFEQPPASPEPAAATPYVDATQVEQDRLAGVNAKNNAAGRGATYLTSGLGLTGIPKTENKKLLGQ